MTNSNYKVDKKTKEYQKSISNNIIRLRID
jgi:hypothetical protein